MPAHEQLSVDEKITQTADRHSYKFLAASSSVGHSVKPALLLF